MVVKVNSRLFLGTISALLFAAVSSQAQWTYFDVSDGVTNPAPANTFDASTGSSLLWGQGTDSAVTYGWRYRTNSGPGVPAWDLNVYSGFATSNQFGANPDPALYTLAGGLLASTDYYVRVYGVYPRSATNEVISSRSRFGAEFSLDGGTTWEDVDTKGSTVINWVDNSSPLGALTGVPGSGDSRYYTLLGFTLTTDGSGVARIDLRLPLTLSNAENTDRFNIDGYALSVVPEPGTVALLGVGLSGLLMLARRKRA